MNTYESRKTTGMSTMHNFTRDMCKIWKLADVAEMLNLPEESIQDIIACGDLPAVGSNKDMIRARDLYSFLGVEFSMENLEGTIDFVGKRRSNGNTSNEIECICINDITEEEWNVMKKNGTKEHRPYYDERKGQWCIALSLGRNAEGKRIRKIITGKTQETLWQKYRSYVEDNKNNLAPVPEDAPIVMNEDAKELNIPVYSAQQDVLFAEQYTKFLKGLENTVVNRTYAGYVTNSKYILEQLGHLNMYEINKEVLQNFFNDLTKAQYASGKSKTPNTYYSQRYITGTFNLLHRFIRDCADDTAHCAVLPKDYMDKMKKPKSKALKKEEVVPCTDKQINQVFEAVQADAMISCWVHLLVETGCRPSEALALKWSDIDFQKKRITINKTLGKEADYDPITCKRVSKFQAIIKEVKNERGKTNYHNRVLPVSEITLDELFRWKKIVDRDKKLTNNRREYGTAEYVFTSSTGKLVIYDQYRLRYRRLLKKHGLDIKDVNPYRFRHTMCTSLFRHKVDAKTVQMIMGDNTIDVVFGVYTNMQKEDILNTSNVLEDRMMSIVNSGKQVAR